MTVSGILLAPLLMALFLLPRVYAIPALYLGAVLSDASMLNVGSRPLLVPWFVALLVITREAWTIVIGGARLRIDVLQRLAPMAAFVIACCLSLIIALAFFQTDVMVLPGSAGFDLKLTEWFHFVPENLNQLVYTGLIFVLVTVMANLAADLEREQLGLWIDRAMRWSCALATVAIVWHVASFTFGIWFWDDFFHSSIKSGAWEQGGFGDMAGRPSGSFSEPSELTYYGVMLLFYFFQQWRRRGAIGDQISLTVTIGLLLISTSTTAYILLAVFAVLAGADLVLGRPARRREGDVRRGATLRGRHIVSVLILAGVIASGSWLFGRNQSVIDTVYQDQIVGKSQSRSYSERSTADRMAWQIFFDTYGFGLGLGSHRPNSGLLTVVSGSGLLGTLAVIWFLLQNLSRPDPSTFDHDAEGDASKPVRWAVLGLLLAHLVSGPNIQSTLIWTSLALATAFHLKRDHAVPARARIGLVERGAAR